MHHTKLNSKLQLILFVHIIDHQNLYSQGFFRLFPSEEDRKSRDSGEEYLRLQLKRVSTTTIYPGQIEEEQEDLIEDELRRAVQWSRNCKMNPRDDEIGQRRKEQKDHFILKKIDSLSAHNKPLLNKVYIVLLNQQIAKERTTNWRSLHLFAKSSVEE